MMKASEVIAATKAAIADFDFTGVTTDSRAVKPGELFVALLAYQQLAHAYRLKQQGLKVFAITGSNGKTSTKDLLAACLGAKYKVVKTQGNFNNEIGLPKTLLSIQPDTDIAVVEMGMRGLGQIAELCRIAEPDSGLITNVGETHMELLGSMENIGKAKSEIVVDLPSDGFAVLNGDNEYVLAAAGKTKAQVVYFGLGENCDYRGSDIVTSAFRCPAPQCGTAQQSGPDRAYPSRLRRYPYQAG